MSWFTKSTTTALGLLYFVSCQIDSDSSHFQLVGLGARSRVTHGDNITYSFSITFNVSSTVDHVSMIVNGSNLQVLDSRNLHRTNITWQTPNGNEIETDGSSLAMDVIKESDLHPISEIDFQLPAYSGSLKLQRIKGHIDFHIAEAVALGSLLRPNMYLSFLSGTVLITQTALFGDYVFMELPELKISSAEPGAVEMKERSTIMSSVLLPTKNLKSSSLSVYMPRNVTSSFYSNAIYQDEPYLTVTDFQFVGYSGLPEDFSILQNAATPDYQSSSRTSEMDSVSMIIPEIDYVNNNNTNLNFSVELDFLTKVEGLDFVGSTDGIEVELVYVLQVGENFLIIRHCSLAISRSFKVERSPKLNFTLEFIELYTVNEETDVEYQLRIWHTENVSWSSAYDISVFLYLPPFLHGVNMLKAKDVIKTNTAVENIVHANCIEMTVPRVSFAQNIRLQFSLNLDIRNKHYIPGEEFLIIAEIVYTGWRDANLVQNMEGFEGYFNVSKGNDVKPSCECVEGEFAQCRCSTDNACNGRIDNITCVDCNYPWHCVKTLPGYGMKSSLKDGKGGVYICPATRRYIKSSCRNSCYHKQSNGTITRLPSKVGNILGRDKHTGYLYGISQNGLAYITSMDDGVTWYSIHPSMYARATQYFVSQMAILT